MTSYVHTYAIRAVEYLCNIIICFFVPFVSPRGAYFWFSWTNRLIYSDLQLSFCIQQLNNRSGFGANATPDKKGFRRLLYQHPQAIQTF